MDNILKMVLGCLGISAVLVMFIPSENPLPAPAEAAIANASDDQPAPLPSSEAAAPLPSNADQPGKVSGFAVDNHDIESFGQPMVDPTPPGQRTALENEDGPSDENENGRSSMRNVSRNYSGVGGESQSGSADEDE